MMIMRLIKKKKYVSVSKQGIINYGYFINCVIILSGDKKITGFQRKYAKYKI